MPKLPIVLSPYHAYLHEANTFSVLFAYPQFAGWLYSRFIQLRWAKDWLFTFMPENIYTGMPFLQQEWLYRKSFLEDRGNIIDYIRTSVDRGMYAAMYVNESYLSGVGQNWGCHNTLVYGYDNAAQTLDILAFDHNQHYTMLTCTYDEFAAAFETCTCYPYSLQDRITRFRVSETESYKLNLSEMAEWIDAYLAGEDCDYKTGAYANLYHEKNPVWGINCYAKIREFYETKNASRQYMDLRIIYALYEHKLFMYNRLCFLQKYRYVHGLEDCINTSAQIVKICGAFKNTVMHYNMTYCTDRHNPDKMQAAIASFIDTIIELEIPFLEKFRQLLREQMQDIRDKTPHLPDTVLPKSEFDRCTGEILRDGDWFVLDNVHLGDTFSHEIRGIRNIFFTVGHCCGQGSVEIRLHSLTGQKIGQIDLAETENPCQAACLCSYKLPAVMLRNQYHADIYFIARGGDAFAADIQSVFLESDFHVAGRGYKPLSLDWCNMAAACDKLQDAGYYFDKRRELYFISFKKRGSWVRYRSFDFYKAIKKIGVYAFSSLTSPCGFYIYLDSLDTKPIAIIPLSCTYDKTADYALYDKFYADLPPVEGTHDLYIQASNDSIQLIWFWFDE